MIDPIFLFLTLITFVGLIIVVIYLAAHKLEKETSLLNRLPHLFDNKKIIIYQVIKLDTGRKLFNSLGVPLERISFAEEKFLNEYKIRLDALLLGAGFIALIKKEKTKSTEAYIGLVFVPRGGVVEHLGLDYDWRTSVGCSSTLFLVTPVH